MTLPGIELEFREWPAEESIRMRGGLRYKFRNCLVQDEKTFQEMLTILRACQRVAYDTETSGLHPHLGARICGHSFTACLSPQELTNWYVPVRHQKTSEPQLQPEHVAAGLNDLFSRNILLVGHHFKFDMLLARADGISISPKFDDTSIMAVVLNENEMQFGLKPLAAKYICQEARNEEKRLEEWMKKDARELKLAYRKRRRSDEGEDDEPTYLERYGFARSPIRLCGLYACHDTAYTWLLYEAFSPRVLANFRDVYEREIGVSWYLHEMEWWGLPINVEEIHLASALLKDDMAFWRSEIEKTTGPGFELTDANLRSLFYDRCSMEMPKLTKGGASGSVDKEARSLLIKKYPDWAPLVKAVDRYAVSEKLHSTYSSSWIKHIANRRVHSSYNQLEQRDEEGVPKTGRLGSSNPNAQNIAKKSVHLARCACKTCVKEKGLPVVGPTVIVSVRRYYVVPPGFVRVFIDLSQIELRVLAWFSRDEVMLYCYAHDLDIHEMTAKDVTNGNRDVAKIVNFGNNYGQTKIGLAKRLPYYAEDPERALTDAEAYLDAYFKKYNGIPKFRKWFANEMRQNKGMFINPFGRPRRIESILSEDFTERSRAERMMMSSIISGTAADMLKEIILRTGRVLKSEYAHLAPEQRGRLVQTIHDENIYDLPIAGCGPVIVKLMKCFTYWPQFEGQGVPIRASCKLSTTSWEEAGPIEVLPDGSFRWAT